MTHVRTPLIAKENRASNGVLKSKYNNYCLVPLDISLVFCIRLTCIIASLRPEVRVPALLPLGSLLGFSLGLISLGLISMWLSLSGFFTVPPRLLPPLAIISSSKSPLQVCHGHCTKEYVTFTKILTGCAETVLRISPVFNCCTPDSSEHSETELSPHVP